MHIGEVCEVKWEEIDMQKGTYCTIRAKTEAHRIPRAATLWPETLAALEAMPRKGASPYVFTSAIGMKYNRNKRVNTFKEFRDAAKLPHITFDSLRDGAFTAACRLCSDERWARVLAGHRSPGLQDSYVLRSPEIVRPACDAVYREYGPFPTPA
jgi:integrase